jgi:nucleoside-diphosphate-sugar epimerase
LRQYLRRRVLLVPRGNAYNWGYVEDAARAHLLAMQLGEPGESYIIAGPPHTLSEALTVAERITGLPARRLRLSPGPLRGLAALMSVAGRAGLAPARPIAEYLRVGAGVTYLGSDARARRELGFGPRGIEQGLRETLAYEQAVLHGDPDGTKLS